MTKRKSPERDFQKQVCEFLKLALPADSFFSAIPGGDGKMTRAPGYVSGMPDVMVIHDWTPIFFELKAPKGRVSDVQTMTHNALRCAGADVYVVRSLAEVSDHLRGCGVPLRAEVV
jgi:hypothetical protein